MGGVKISQRSVERLLCGGSTNQARFCVLLMRVYRHARRLRLCLAHDVSGSCPVPGCGVPLRRFPRVVGVFTWLPVAQILRIVQN